MKNKILILLLVLSLVTPIAASAQVGSNFWKFIGGVLSPNVVGLTDFRLPFLGSSGTPCVTVDTDGDFGTSTCGGASIDEAADYTWTGLHIFNGEKPRSSGNATTSDQLVNFGQVSQLFTTGSRFVGSARVSTTGALDANNYSNGASGVGATLTKSSNGALPAIDGVSLSTGNFILVRHESSQLKNGYYVVTSLGSAGTPWVLTRAGNYDEQTEIETGTFFNITEGTQFSLDQYAMNNNATITVGTDSITFDLLSASNVYTASGGIALSGFDFFLNLLNTSLGGLGLDGSGKLQIKALGVITSMINDLAVTTAKIDDLAVTAAKIANGAIDLAGTKITGKLGEVNGGTDQSTYTTGDVLYADGANSLAKRSIGTSGQVFTVSGGVPIWADATGGSGGTATTSFGATTVPWDFISSAVTNQAMGAAPAGDQEFGSAAASSTISRRFANLQRGEAFYLEANQQANGVAGQTLRVQCSSDGISWSEAGDSNGYLNIAVAATPRPKSSNWTSLSPACKSDVIRIRLMGNGGNGVANPTFKSISMHVRNTQPAAGEAVETSIPLSFLAVTTAQPFTNMVAATTTRADRFFDATNATEFRLTKNQTILASTATNARVWLECSADGVSYVQATTDPNRFLSIFAVGQASTTWMDLTPTCQTRAAFRLLSSGGVGAASDPAFTDLSAQFNTTEIALGGSGASDFTFATNFGQLMAATSSPIWGQGGFFASSTSWFKDIVGVGSSTISLDLSPTSIIKSTVGLLNLPALGASLNGAFNSIYNSVTQNQALCGVADLVALGLSADGVICGHFSPAGSSLLFADGDDSSTIIALKSSDASTSLTFAVATSSIAIANDSNDNYFTILQNGNVGIASSSPNSKLTVDGPVTFQGTSFATTTIGRDKSFITIKDRFIEGLDLYIPTLFGRAFDTIAGTIDGIGINHQLIVIEDPNLNADPLLSFVPKDANTNATIVYSTSTDKFLITAGGGTTFSSTTTAPCFSDDGGLSCISGGASQWDNITGGINYAGGKVGIGTTTGTAKFSIYDTLGVGSEIYSASSTGSSYGQQITTLGTGTSIGQLMTSQVAADGTAYGGFILATSTDPNNLAQDLQGMFVFVGPSKGRSNAIVGGGYDIGVGGVLSGEGDDTEGFVARAINGTDPFVGSTNGYVAIQGNANAATSTGTNFGVIGSASGGLRNFAGAFVNGDVIIKNNLGIGTSSPQFDLDVLGDVAFRGLTASAGTPSSICQNATTKEITVNAALTCTVSARDQKDLIDSFVDLDLSGIDLLKQIQPQQFAYKDDLDRLRWGFIADEVQAVDPKLGDAYNEKGEARSIDPVAILAVTVKATQELNQKVDDLELGKVVKSADDNKQWLALIFLLVLIGFQQVQIIKLKK